MFGFNGFKVFPPVSEYNMPNPLEQNNITFENMFSVTVHSQSRRSFPIFRSVWVILIQAKGKVK